MAKSKFWIGPAIVAVLVAAGAFYLLKDKPKPGEVVIKEVDTPTTPNNWELVEKLTGRDVLKEENVKVQDVPVISGPLFQALLADQLDVAGFDWTGWINVVARGGKIKAVYGGAAVTKEIKTGILVLETSGIRAVKDLRGKSIAVNTLGLGAEYDIKIYLEKNGLKLDQVQLLQVPVENEEEALRTSQVNAAAGTTGGGTWFDRALDKGGVRIVPGTDRYDIYGHDATIYALGFKDDFIQAHPDAVRRYVTAARGPALRQIKRPARYFLMLPSASNCLR